MDAHTIPLLAALAVAALTGLAEYWHARRSRELSRLVFGPAEAARSWTRMAPALRVLACAALAWGLSLLALAEPELLGSAGGDDPRQEADPADVQRVLLVLDVSPSMNAEDAGSEQTMRRRDRVMQVVEGVLSRIALSRTKFSVVVFFTSARPVVVDAVDTQVVRNILDNLPLVWSFEPGQTRLVDGLTAAGELAEKWPPESTTMFLCTDGDTVDFSQVPTLPRSIRDVQILAVGDPLRSTRVGAHESRQQAAILKRLAVELRGRYYNVNRRHLPSEALTDLARAAPPPPDDGLQLKDLARILVGLGALVLVLLPVALQYGGSLWKPHRELPAAKGDAANVNAANVDAAQASQSEMLGAGGRR
ncbi:MAG: vWA domain-containing protein [Pirellulaceae bacterium]